MVVAVWVKVKLPEGWSELPADRPGLFTKAWVNWHAAYEAASPDDDDEWLADLLRIARAPHGWDLGDGRRMPVGQLSAVRDAGEETGDGLGRDRGGALRVAVEDVHRRLLLLVIDGELDLSEYFPGPGSRSTTRR